MPKVCQSLYSVDIQVVVYFGCFAKCLIIRQLLCGILTQCDFVVTLCKEIYMYYGKGWKAFSC